SEEEETREEEEESFDPIPRTPEDSEDDGNGKKDQGLRVSEEQRLIEEEEADELYHDQESSSVSSFMTSMLNPISDAGVESIFTTASSLIAPLQTPTPIITPSTIATITISSDAPIPPTTILCEVLQNLPTFDSQTTKAVREAVQIQTDRLQDSFQRENDEFIRTIDENMKRIIKEQVKSQVKEQVSQILPKIEESVNAHLEAEVLTRSSHSSRTSYAVAAYLTEMELKKILIEKMEGNKEDVGMMMIRKDPPLDQTGGLRDEEKVGSLNQLALHLNQQPEVQTGAEDQPIIQSSQHPEWFSQSKKPPTPDHDWNTTLPAAQGRTQLWISDLAKQADSRSSFNELLDTPIDFSNFIMNRLGVDTLTPELLAGPTYELMRGSCNSLTELEYHLELMRIDELHKFSDGTLNDVRNALDDSLKGIKMQYPPQTIWRKSDKDRAAAMIQAIDKMLKTNL
nr:hypothetical protein [Tanacetum cinerariifolium]